MKKTNKFLSENINVAIISAQYDMRGYVHPLGFRSEGISSKPLSYVPYNLIAFAGGAGKKDENGENMKMTIDANLWFDYLEKELTYEKVITICKKFADECHYVQKEAVKFLLKDVLDKTAELEEEAKLKNEKDNYLRPLDKKSNWGKIMLGLMEAFDVKVNEPVTIEKW